MDFERLFLTLVFVTVSSLSYLCFDLKPIALTHLASEGERRPYEFKSPECITPKYDHLCSDFSSKGPDHGIANHFFKVTCDDSCGNAYMFREKITFEKDTRWKVTRSSSHSVKVRVVLAADNPASLALKSVDQEVSKVESEAKQIVEDISRIWRKTLQAYLPPVSPKYLSIKNHFTLFSVEKTLPEPQLILGYLSELIVLASELNELNPSPQTLGQRELIGNIIGLMQYNHEAFLEPENKSTGFLRDLQAVGARLGGKAEFLPPSVIRLLLDLASNKNLKDMLARFEANFEKKEDLNRKKVDLEKSIDPHAVDEGYDERCISLGEPHMELYPRSSPFLEKRERIIHLLEGEHSAFDRQALYNQRRRDESAKFPSKAGEKRSDQYKSIVSMPSFSDWRSSNALTQKELDVLNQNVDEKEKEKAFAILEKGCEPIVSRLEDSPLDHLPAKNSLGRSSAPNLDATLILRAAVPIRKNLVTLEVTQDRTGNFAGHILVSDSGADRLSLSQICDVLAKFCRSVSSGETPALEVELPYMEKLPRKLTLPVYRNQP